MANMPECSIHKLNGTDRIDKKSLPICNSAYWHRTWLLVLLNLEPT